jgi:ectoine hydroxylase
MPATTTSHVTTPLATKATDDPYPSRVRPEPEVLPRLDPVVYGDAESGPLPQQQLRRYEENGFLVLPGFFSDSVVAECQAELRRLSASPEICQRPEAILEPDNEELRSLFAVHQPDISPLFSRIAADPRIVGMAMQIVGGEVAIHQSRVNLKPGFAGQEFNWHSDFETWHVEDGMPHMRAVSCSIFLTENTPLNGPLMLIPRSHHSYLACVGETPDDHYRRSLRRQEYGVPDNDLLQHLYEEGGIEAAVGPPGTVVLFDCNTMHGSNSNITPLPRSNLFFVYNSTANPLVEPFCGKKPRPEFIAARTRVTPLTPPLDFGRQHSERRAQNE